MSGIGSRVGDESQVVSDVVQNGLRTFRHHKDLQTKLLAHPFVGQLILFHKVSKNS